MRRVSIILVCMASIGCIAGLAGCSGSGSGPYQPSREQSRDTERAQKLTQQAVQAMVEDPSTKGLERGEKLLRDALTADLYHGPAHNNLGVVFLKRGMLYEAASEFEWARKLMPGHPDPRMNLALTLEQAGQVDLAIDTYLTALETYPGHMPTIQALTRLELYEQRATPQTTDRLRQIALRGEGVHWRSWARQQLADPGIP